MNLRIFQTLAVAFASVACAGADPTGPLTLSALCAQKDAVVAEVPFLTIDDGFEEVARLLPGGFGGLVSDSMFLKDVTQADTARGTARALATCPGQTVPYLGAVLTAGVRRGDYDWVELRRWYRLLQAQSRDFPGLVATDMDERTNRLYFRFATQEGIDAFRIRAASLGIPLGALTFDIGMVVPARLVR